MKDKKEEVRVISSPFILFAVIITSVLGYGVLIFINVYSVAREQMLDGLFGYCFFVFIVGGCPTILIIMSFVQGMFSVVTIDAQGVRRAVFGKFRKRQMTWDEVIEIRFFPRVTPYILFTNKDLSNENLFSKNVIAHKNIIAVEMRKKVIDAIERFTDKEISGISDN